MTEPIKAKKAGVIGMGTDNARAMVIHCVTRMNGQPALRRGLGGRLRGGLNFKPPLLKLRGHGVL